MPRSRQPTVPPDPVLRHKRSALPIVYLTHPLGEKSDAKALVKRHNHAANAHGWFRWAFLVTGWPITAPWIPYLISVDDELHRPKVRAHLGILQGTANVIVAVGGEISPHMSEDQDRATKRSLPWVDLTDLGYTPPSSDNPSYWRHLIEERATLPILGVRFG